MAALAVITTEVEHALAAHAPVIKLGATPHHDELYVLIKPTGAWLSAVGTTSARWDRIELSLAQLDAIRTAMAKLEGVR